MKKVILSVLIGLCFSWPMAYAQTSTDTDVIAKINELAKKVEELQSTVKGQQGIIANQSLEINQLKSIQIGKPEGAPKLPAAPGSIYIPPQQTQPNWLEGMKWGGDLRLRYEGIDHSANSVRDINRFRFRLRYGFEKELSPDWKVGVRLATGSATDPTTREQTMGTNFGEKSIWIDRVYAIYNPNWLTEKYKFIEKVRIGGGKFENPYRNLSQMIWDSDVTPEGFYEEISFKLTDKITAYTTEGQFITTTNDTSPGDSQIYAFQGGLKFDLGSFLNMEKYKPRTNSQITFYDYANYAGYSNFGTLAWGNTNVDQPSSTLDAKRFHVLHIYNDYSMDVYKKRVAFYAEYAQNLDEHAKNPENQSHAYGGGIRIGELKKKSDWATGYGYYYIEPNSVVAAFSCGEFEHGNSKGSEIFFDYMLTDFLQVNLSTYLFGNISDVGTVKDSIRRFRINVLWKF